MNITQLKQSIPYLIEAGLVPNIIGKHGIGKSSVISQFAKDNGYSFHPFFLGQMSDVGDLLGLPEFDRDSEGKAISTSFIHPKKLPKKEKSILFFDELNRATKDLLQAIFQLALEGSIHDYVLPKNSAIIMAMNPATDDYAVLDFADKAFADRFVHINLDPTHEEFHNYMTGRYGNSSVSSFLKVQTKLLEETDLKPVTLDFVKPSRRSWDRLQKLENTKMPENLFREAGMGIVGTSAMLAYISWRESQVKILDGVRILDEYDKVRNEFIGYFKNPLTMEDLEIPRNDIVSTVCSSVLEELQDRLTNRTVTSKNVENFSVFLEEAPIENTYAILLTLSRNQEFTRNEFVSKFLLSNEKIIDKVKEAKKAKTEYKKSQNKINEEEIPF